ncbi:hypothetical protein B0H66DRAFT_600658 [Apodospora peruviana]|uniref:DUF6594 domain-containing protein n=1 Tax=Apodospora peruviana TaxID=516989 RepID=A0AAE0IKF2_9PEZI|nr:hypothetical protein B0H66DRAFT_600658 [Apodospora peruviana]
MSNPHLASTLEQGGGPSVLAEDVEDRPDNSNDWERTLSNTGQVGIAGLSWLMSNDPQYNFYPCFEDVATEVLLHSTWNIKRNVGILRRIQGQRRQTLHSRSLGASKREKKVIRKLRKELSAYYAFRIKLSTVVQQSEPQLGSVQDLKYWTEKNCPAWHRLLNETDAGDLRSVWPRQGQIDNLILKVRRTKLGNALMRPFVSKRQQVGEVEMQIFKPEIMSRFSSAASLWLLGILFYVPVALLSYQVLDRGVSIGVALIFCFVFNLLAQWLAADRVEIFYILVLGYIAIIGGNIIDVNEN